MKPLIHIGYHKTGTTWLQKLVFSNPDLGFISPVSTADLLARIVAPNPLDYYHEDCQPMVEEALQTAAARGLVPVFSAERFSGSPHAGGFDSKIVAERLCQLFADARVLIVIREQKSSILSCYKQHVRTGGAISLRAYIDLPERMQLQIPLFSFDHFKYHRLIKLYYSLFGQENVLVLPYELFVAHPAEFTQQLFSYAGAPDTGKKLGKKRFERHINQSLSPFELQVRRSMNAWVGSRNQLNQHSPFPLHPDRISKLYALVNKLDRLVPASYNRRVNQRWEQTVSSVVGDRFKESNRLTAELTGIDLASWGYDL